VLFNSHEFLLLFLPVCLVGFLVLGRRSVITAAGFLAIASVGFYAYWEPRNLYVLGASIVLNYTAGIALARTRGVWPEPKRKILMIAAVAANLALLGWFKYAGFAAENAAALGITWDPGAILLPLGISFFTFTQIAFLVDAWRGEAKEYSPLNYILFVTFFPHLIAGPIIHHKDMMPQFADPETYRMRPDRIAQGLMILAIGLIKKIVIADSLAPFADDAFASAATRAPTLLEAWSGTLAYTFQIYFDFSAYSDMAVGLALMFGILLPWNFNSPYKAISIIDFWRRWHITLSRFLRNYLYYPLGGNRRGRARTYANILIVMLLGGLWHGAGWTFIAWGAVHGAMILVNHAWRDLRPVATSPSWQARLFGWTLTFTGISVAWVFFRAPDMATAEAMLSGLAGLNGVALGQNHAIYLGALAPTIAEWGIRFLPNTTFSLLSVPWLGFALLWCLMLPNAKDWTEGCHKPFPGLFSYRVTTLSGAATGLAIAIAVGLLGGPSAFLYFNF